MASQHRAEAMTITGSRISDRPGKLMKTVRLPHSDLEIGKAVFGTGRLGGTVERYDKREAVAILRAAKDAGINCFDTADIYGQGNSERLLAEAFRQYRDEVVYATKGGYVLSAKALLLAKIKPLVRRFLKARPAISKAAARARGGQMSKCFSREHLTRAVNASLSRLKTDFMDIYQLHSPDPVHLTDSDAFDTLAELKSCGKIRSYGVSVLSWEDVPLCFGRGVSWIQVAADLSTRTDQAEWCARAADEQVMLVARQIFSAGLLLRDPAELGPVDCAGDDDALARLKACLEAVRRIGDPAGVMLRYLMHHAPFGAFIFATTRLPNLRQNIAALGQPAFLPDEVSKLQGCFPPGARSLTGG